ncbi:MAG: hypothetical protein WBF53_09425 [Litorimonas sp.]
MFAAISEAIAVHQGMPGPQAVTPERWAPPVGQALIATQAAMAPLPVSMQLCLPSPLWDWPADAPGSMSARAYEFCSYAAKRPGEWGRYEASSQRLSDAYALFLSALAPSSMATAAQAALTDATNLTQVNYGNGPKMMPDWMITQSPDAFVAASVGKPGLAATIVVDLTRPRGTGPQEPLFSVGKGAAAAPIMLAAGAVTRLELHADAWADVAVRPGAWFDGALVRLLSRGPFQGGLTFDSFFGPAGILRGMVTGLQVGLNVTVVATLDGRAASAIQREVAGRRPVAVAGFVYDAAGLEASTADGMETLTFPAASMVSETGTPAANVPMIVGVGISTIA